MHKILSSFILSVPLLLLSCTQSKHIPAKQARGKVNHTLSDATVKASAFARLFISDVERELNQQQTAFDGYAPTEALIDKYGLLLFRGKYLVQGFITVDSSLNSRRLEELGITTGKPLGNKMTVSIPLPSLADFLNLPGVDYFEMNPKASLQH